MTVEMAVAVGDRSTDFGLPRLDPREWSTHTPRLVVGGFSLLPELLWGRAEREIAHRAHDEVLHAVQVTSATSIGIILDTRCDVEESEARRLLRVTDSLVEKISSAATNFLAKDVTVFGIAIASWGEDHPEGSKLRTCVHRRLRELIAQTKPVGPSEPMAIDAHHLQDHSLRQIFDQGTL